jgi:hypothetical protein
LPAGAPRLHVPAMSPVSATHRYHRSASPSRPRHSRASARLKASSGSPACALGSRCRARHRLQSRTTLSAFKHRDHAASIPPQGPWRLAVVAAGGREARAHKKETGSCAPRLRAPRLFNQVKLARPRADLTPRVAHIAVKSAADAANHGQRGLPRQLATVRKRPIRRCTRGRIIPTIAAADEHLNSSRRTMATSRRTRPPAPRTPHDSALNSADTR